MIIHELLVGAVASLIASGRQDTPQLDAELLLAYCLQRARSFLFTYPEFELTRDICQQFQGLLARRLKGEPIAYILGHKEFWGLDLLSTPAALMPRAETELLVERVLAVAPSQARILDLGTGSGAIALALASERPSWQLVATDISEEALQLAQQNADRLALKNIHFYLGSWFAALPSEEPFDVIVSNPPYIAEGDPHLNHATLQFEPYNALVSGADGLDAIRAIIRQARRYLKPGGYLLLEHGHDQSVLIVELLQAAGFLAEFFYDYQGIARVVQTRSAAPILAGKAWNALKLS